MSKPAITSIWDWSKILWAHQFFLQHYTPDSAIFTLWIDKDDPYRVYIYDELEDDGFVEYYVDGVAQVTWAKEDTHRYLQRGE